MEKMTRKKWLLAIPLLALLLLIGFVAFYRKSVRRDIFIFDGPDMVWAVLVDGPSYRKWNPVLFPVEGEIVQGGTVRYQWRQPRGKETERVAIVVELVQNELLRERGGTFGILTFDHCYQLIPEEGGTRVVQSEVCGGIGALFWDASQTGTEVQRVNEGIRGRVMALRDMERRKNRRP